MRRLVYWSSVIIVGIASIIFGTVALLIFMNFGTGKAIEAQGFEVPGEELSSCSSLLIDVESIDLRGVPEVAELVGAEEYLNISTSNGIPLKGVLSSRATIDQALLGRTTCILSLEPAVSVSVVSSGDEPLLTDSIEPTIYSESGSALEVPLQLVEGSSLAIEGEFEVESDLRANASIYFAQAQGVLLVAGVVALILLMTEVLLIILGVVRRNRRRVLAGGES